MLVEISFLTLLYLKVEGEVQAGTFTQFLRHLYGRPIEVAKIRELSVLVQLHSICRQFEQVELNEEVMERLEKMIDKEIMGPKELVEVYMLLIRHGVRGLLFLVKAKIE